MAQGRFFTEKIKYDRRYCDVCGRPMPASYPDTTCQSCLNDTVYKEVKEFLLHNEATELEVADRFDLPLETIRRWIKEGHLAYRDENRDQ